MVIAHPKISIVMPVFNGERFLAEAVNSVLNQTYKNFELIIVDDGSTDDSTLIIKQFNDPRIIFIPKKHSGFANTLNVGLKTASGNYIARMDADDISEQNRLEEQINFLESHKDIYFCGAWAKIINEDGKLIGEYTYPPLNPTEIKKMAIRTNPFIHSSVMFKKEVIEKIGMYNKNFKYVEDYEMWIRTLKYFQTANMPKLLVRYRIVQSGMTQSKNLRMKIMSIILKLYYIRELISFTYA